MKRWFFAKLYQPPLDSPKAAANAAIVARHSRNLLSKSR
jgi:hypothetical protein